MTNIFVMILDCTNTSSSSYFTWLHSSQQLKQEENSADSETGWSLQLQEHLLALALFT